MKKMIKVNVSDQKIISTFKMTNYMQAAKYFITA